MAGDAELVDCPYCREYWAGYSHQERACPLCCTERTARDKPGQVADHLAGAYRMHARHRFDHDAAVRARLAFRG